MSKKLIFLTSFVLVLGLTVGVANADIDSDLVAWWSFNDVSGNTAVDHVSGINGTLKGDTGGPKWVDGKIGKALQFEGANNDYVDCGTHLAIGITGSITLAAWIKIEQWHGSSWDPIIWKFDNTGDRAYRLSRNGASDSPTLSTDGVSPEKLNGTIAINDGEWNHIVGVYDQDAGKTYLYVDGVEDVKQDASGNIADNTNGPLWIGIESDAPQGQPLQRGWNGLIDEVRIYARALSPEDIKELYESMSLATPKGNARSPSPADGATDVPANVILSWTPGAFAPPTNGHTVYLSKNFNNVFDGIGGFTQDANSYAPPQRLDFSTTYYWRVDEVNGPPDYTVYEGSVWNFTTEPAAYPIEDITATASSALQADMGPENTVDGSGLDPNGLHSTDATDMWISSVGPLGAWIQYEFNKVYKLHQMWVWNSNQTTESLFGFGLKDVTIEYSTNGTNYMTLGTTHEFARAPGAAGYESNTTVDLSGVAAKYIKITANSNWGSIVPQYSLSEVRFFHIPVRAREPSPDSGATDVDVDVTLGFRVGREAAKHDVYLSTDEQVVIDGTAPASTVTEPSHGPLSLDLAQIYYWKINEVNTAESPTTWEGDVWNFATREFLVVDDFESYNDLNPDHPESNRIFNTWIDGYEQPTNGAVVGYTDPPFCERTVVHGGRQSMPLLYNNTGGAVYSEAELTLTLAQNWTASGIVTLAVHFHGTEGNTGQLYAKVNGTKVVYDGDAGDITKPQWQQWNIDLASLGIDTQNVTKLSIGIDGNGASGKLYVDDIRLYRLAP